MIQFHMLSVQPLLAAGILIEAQFVLPQLATVACCMLTSVFAMSSFCCTVNKIELHG